MEPGARVEVEGLSSSEATARLARDGPNEVPEEQRAWWRVFAGKLWGLSAWMIEAIAALSFVLGKNLDGAVALGLLLVNAVLGTVQETRASAAVVALRQRLAGIARVRRDGSWTNVPNRALVVGDVIRVRAGDVAPADAEIVDGTLRVDESTLTGESREIVEAPRDVLRSGTLVRRGEATLRVTAIGVHTLFGRTAELVAHARPKLHVEAVVDRLVRWLFVVVGLLVAITVGGSLVEGLPLADVLPLSLVLLMSAVPVALPVMFTVSMAVGSIELSRHGALLARLSAAEDAATLDVLCADKTGTLTTNHLALVGVTALGGASEQDVVEIAAQASNDANRDPIDVAILEAARARDVEVADVISFTPFSADTRRTEAVVVVRGTRRRVVKGALRTIASLAGVDGDARASIEAVGREVGASGARVLAVAQGAEDGALTLVGLVHLADPPRADSAALVATLRSLGVRVLMLTGDALSVATHVAHALGIGEIHLAHALEPAALARALDVGGLAEVLPEDKLRVVEALQAAGHVVGMTGDGVNDAPALRQAEVGIAVSGATDVAKGAASVVLTAEGLGAIVDLVRIGRSVYQRVLTWIVNKVSRTILKAGFVVGAFLATGRFVVSALAMVLLVFMTDFVKVALSTDRVRPSPRPETWDVGPLVGVAAALGALMLAEALGLLAFGWHALGLAAEPARLHTFSFATLLYFALFSLVSIRERRAFWSSAPSRLLGGALLADGIVAALITQIGIGDMGPLGIVDLALVIGVAAALSLGPNDLVKRRLLARIGKA